METVFIIAIIAITIVIVTAIVAYTSTNKQIKPQSDEQLLNELISSERYINSPYKIHQFGTEYALCMKESDILNSFYLDLTYSSCTWKTNSVYFEDCLGTVEEVIEAFNMKVPKILNKHSVVIIFK